MQNLIKWLIGLTMTLSLSYALVANTAFGELNNLSPPWAELFGSGYFPEPKRDPRTDPKFQTVFHDSTHSFDVRFYNLKIILPMINAQFRGINNILCTSNQNGLNTVSLDCVELTVDSVLVDGVLAVYDTNQGKINITLGPYNQGQNFQVLVGYHGIANTTYGGGWFPAGMSYFRRGQYSAPETTAYSMAEPSDARRWFPCFDEPWDKADSSRIDATVPKQFQVASNGILTSVDTVGDLATYHWLEKHPISTYLMSVAITKYAILRDEYVSNGDTVPIMHFVYHADSAQAVAGYQTVPDMIAFYSDTFCEYPFSKYGMAVVSPFGGGMEHQTMTTILDYYTWEDGIAHELAHMWWGDMITCADWPNIWLNEGFATYTQALWDEHHHGWATFQSTMQSNQNNYFDQASSYDFPIFDPPPGELFNGGIVYSKGACIMHMLRYVLGETDFWQMWPAYADSFKYGNANTPDFQRICEQVSGQGMDWFFQEWVYDLGYPHYEYGWRSVDLGSNQYQLDVQVRQVQTQGPIFRMPLEFRFTAPPSVDTILSGLDSLEFQEFRFIVNLAQAPTTLNFDPDNWIIDEHDQVPYNGVVSDNSNLVPTLYYLSQSYPNPMTNKAKIDFTLPQEGHVRLAIYNILGQTIKVIVNEKIGAGFHSVYWDGRDQNGKEVSAGVYFYKMEAGEFSATQRLIVIR